VSFHAQQCRRQDKGQVSGVRDQTPPTGRTHRSRSPHSGQKTLAQARAWGGRRNHANSPLQRAKERPTPPAPTRPPSFLNFSCPSA
jgi:hypothetical protein